MDEHQCPATHGGAEEASNSTARSYSREGGPRTRRRQRFASLSLAAQRCRQGRAEPALAHRPRGRGPFHGAGGARLSALQARRDLVELITVEARRGRSRSRQIGRAHV